MKKIVSLKELQYIQMYRSFYADPRNKELSKHLFFNKADTVNKIRVV